MDLGLTNKVALVIASSQGLGKAVAKELVKEGAHVMLTSRSEDKFPTLTVYRRKSSHKNRYIKVFSCFFSF